MRKPYSVKTSERGRVRVMPVKKLAAWAGEKINRDEEAPIVLSAVSCTARPDKKTSIVTFRFLCDFWAKDVRDKSVNAVNDLLTEYNRGKQVYGFAAIKGVRAGSTVKETVIDIKNGAPYEATVLVNVVCVSVVFNHIATQPGLL